MGDENSNGLSLQVYGNNDINGENVNTPSNEQFSSASASSAMPTSTTDGIDSSAPPSEEKFTTLETQETYGSDAGILFSTRRPRDSIAGFSSGLKNVAKGVGAGIGAFIVVPLASAVEESTHGGNRYVNYSVGFLKGLGIGVIGLATLPIAGVATGIYQIGRGIANQKDAFVEKSRGKEWDPRRRRWVLYELKKEADLVLNESEEQWAQRMEEERIEDLLGKKADEKAKRESRSSSKHNAEIPSRPTKKVKETEYYELLGVETNATQSEIKKAYYKKARSLHPDKNPDDPKAAENFQHLGAAYQVLSNEELREKYDKYGTNGVQDAPILDSSTFFAMIFGSDKFDSIVGELQLATLMGLGADPASPEYFAAGGDEKLSITLDYTQQKREVQCAVNLAATLDRYILAGCNSKTFMGEVDQEAKELGSNAFGGTLLGVVAYVYEEQACKVLGFKHSIAAGIGFVSLKRQGHVLNTKIRVAQSAFKAYRKTMSLQKRVDKVEKEIREKREKEKIAKLSAGEDINPKKNEEAKDNIETGSNNNEAKTKEEEELDEEEEIKRAAMKMLEGEIALETLVVMIETLWNYSVIDIESTLRKSCHKVLYDMGVEKIVRQQRAEGLHVLSQVYKKYSRAPDEGLSEFQEKIAGEFRAAQRYQEMHQQQNGDDDQATQSGGEDEAEEEEQQQTPPPIYTRSQLEEMKAKELKEILLNRKVNFSDCIEKSDYIDKILSTQ